MKKSLDFNEIISNSAQRSASPVNFLGDLAQAYRECAPAEADWICSFLDCFSESLKNTEFNPEAPFMWSYLVDINKDTNIGAGAITCNYDGKKKNRTIIGENCFIADKI